MLDGPVATIVRNLVADDDELKSAVEELRQHVFRGAAWWDDAGRARAGARLRALTPRLAPRLLPAAFTTKSVEALHLPPRTAHLEDARAALLAHACRRRATEVLAGLFEQLRTGALVATGRPPAAPTTRIGIPAELWSATATAVCLRTSDVRIGTVAAFTDVVVETPVVRRSASRAALGDFITAFDSAVAAQGRLYVRPELFEAVRRGLGDVSEREVEAALGRASVLALAGRGRRAAALTPTAAELRAAAERAAEIPR